MIVTLHITPEYDSHGNIATSLVKNNQIYDYIEVEVQDGQTPLVACLSVVEQAGIQLTEDGLSSMYGENKEFHGLATGGCLPQINKGYRWYP